MKKKKLFLISAVLILAVSVGLIACGFNSSTSAETTSGNDKSLDEYASLALEQAQEASDSGTFGVGGILLDIDGNVIYEKHNQVIEGSRTNDPTAHGERQIVDWYLANKEKENLPEPEECILITTLDPCAMCTGVLCQVQFKKVIVIALDSAAGINWQGNGECSALAGTDCQKYVQEHFVYPEVTGELAREAFGADLSDVNLFSDVTITSETLKGCQDAFDLTVADVRKKVSSTAVDIADVQNPAELDPSHPIYKYLSESFGSDFLGCSWKQGESAESIINYIQEKHPGFDGVAYFDSFGNLLYLDDDDENISTQSAFMKVTRKVAAVRNTDPIEGYEINNYLSNPKYGYFVYMTCPEISDVTVMELGAIGSTLENTSNYPIMYIYGEENQKAIDTLIKQLPPLYNDTINIRFEQIPSANNE